MSRLLDLSDSLLEALTAAPAAQPAAATPAEALTPEPARLHGVPAEDSNGALARRDVLKDIESHQSALREACEERESATGAGRQQLELRIQALQAQLERLQSDYQSSFVPKHSGTQLISPRQLFLSPLFNVRGKQTPRQELVKFDLVRSASQTIVYRGPELRQQDGLVFMAMVNLARDYPTGTSLSFEPGEMCRALYGYYDGKARSRLKESIHRLMHAAIEFAEVTVHLAGRFTHPKRGRWSVVLDPDIVKLFALSAYVWLDLETWKKLPEGLTTWLYGFVRSQVTLGQQPLDELARLCGSGISNMSTFHTMLCRALNALVAQGVIEPGWRIRNGIVHWRKPMVQRLTA